MTEIFLLYHASLWLIASIGVFVGCVVSPIIPEVKEECPYGDILSYPLWFIVMCVVCVYFLIFPILLPMDTLKGKITRFVPCIPIFLLFGMPLTFAIGCYRLVRLWDVSWGNRPASSLVETNDDGETDVKKWKIITLALIVIVIGGNIGLILMPSPTRNYIFLTVGFLYNHILIIVFALCTAIRRDYRRMHSKLKSRPVLYDA